MRPYRSFVERVRKTSCAPRLHFENDFGDAVGMTVSALSPDARRAAFPLGGIGTGNVSIGSRGEFRDWELQNSPGKGNMLPFTFPAIDIRGDHQAPITRVLEAQHVPPYEGEQGFDWGRVAGLPRMRSASMTGRYPLLTIDFIDPELPVAVQLTAFTPLVPLDPDESGLPAAVLRYRVRNASSHRLRVAVVESLASPVGMDHWEHTGFPHYADRPQVCWREDDRLRGLSFVSGAAPNDHRYGTAALVTADERTTSKPGWLTGPAFDGAQSFWTDLKTDGRLDPEPRTGLDPGQQHDPPRIGSLAIHHGLEPGQSQDFEFLLGWHLPNRHRGWYPNGANYDDIVLNHYATRFTDAWSVADHLREHLVPLEQATRGFHDALYESDLPQPVLEAAGTSLVVARSTTCFRFDNGTPAGQFAGWEGSFDRAGSCHGTCTHVWNYAQTLAYLFPTLEQSARQNEFSTETDQTGRMNFRAQQMFGDPPWDFPHPAVDGQLGTIVRLYREWRYSGDDRLLNLWPAASRALEFAGSYWDRDNDLMLDGVQHNTYDIEFWGPNPLANVLWLAALRAGSRLAAAAGDQHAADRYAGMEVTARQRIDAHLFNGEYYQQRLGDRDLTDMAATRYQVGSGVLSDQLLGQTLSHLTGLGDLLPVEHLRSAITAVHRHNFRTRIGDHDSLQRSYALNDEAGLLTCSWPQAGRPALPFIYSDEVWTGIEYQVATELIYQDRIDEALAVVAAVRDRFDGLRRSPWNEAECGNHYVRSMAAWGLIIALTGYSWEAADERMRFAPRIGADPHACDVDGTDGNGGTRAERTDGDDVWLRTIFTTHTCQGRAEITGDRITLSVDTGQLVLSELWLGDRQLNSDGLTPDGLNPDTDRSITLAAGQQQTFG